MTPKVVREFIVVESAASQMEAGQGLMWQHLWLLWQHVWLLQQGRHCEARDPMAGRGIEQDTMANIVGWHSLPVQPSEVASSPVAAKQAAAPPEAVLLCEAAWREPKKSPRPSHLRALEGVVLQNRFGCLLEGVEEVAVESKVEQARAKSDEGFKSKGKATPDDDEVLDEAMAVTALERLVQDQGQAQAGIDLKDLQQGSEVQTPDQPCRGMVTLGAAVVEKSNFKVEAGRLAAEAKKADSKQAADLVAAVEKKSDSWQAAEGVAARRLHVPLAVAVAGRLSRDEADKVKKLLNEVPFGKQ